MKVLDNLIQKNGHPSSDLLDLGCGTGKTSIAFKELGYKVTGVDISPSMIEMAKKKPESSGIDFAVSDIRSLSEVDALFGVAAALGEQFHCLNNEEELRSSFEAVRKVLLPGGIFGFEMNTAGTFASLSRSPIVRKSAESFVAISGAGKGAFTPGSAVRITMDYFIREDDHLWKRQNTEQAEQHFPHGDVLRLLKETDFEFSKPED